jgi:ATP:ADP antiporter, AAA family
MKMNLNNNSRLNQYLINITQLISNNRQYILYKYLPTSLMLMLSAYIYSLLRGVKDSILVPSLGAELISFVKFYCVFPGTILFFIFFSKMSNSLSRDKLYYLITSCFIGFFLLYGFVLGPYEKFFHPDLSHWIVKFPGLKYQIIMLENWTVSLFYVMSELCGTVMLTLLFWQFANDLYSVSEAKKTYTLFGLLGQLGLVAAGLLQNNMSTYFAQHYDDNQMWQLTIKSMMLTIALAGIILMMLYRFMYKNVLHNPDLCSRNHSSQKEKVQLSLKNSFKYLFSSRYLWCIMMIVFSYGVGINLVESVWKDQLRLRYSTQNSYSAFIGQFHIYFGFCTIFVMLFGSYILRKFKWIVPALCTPIAAGVTGVMFFMALMFKDKLAPLVEALDMSILLMAVVLGSMQIAVFKSFNYAFVDATKEMAFIPLDRELRTKGKAAVDVVGGRFGKSFGAILQQLMFQFISPNLSDLTGEICTVFLIIIILWIMSVIILNKEFNKVISNTEN